MRLDYSKLKHCIVCKNIEEYDTYLNKKIKIDRNMAEYLIKTRGIFGIYIYENGEEGWGDINGVNNSKKISAQEFCKKLTGHESKQYHPRS